MDNEDKMYKFINPRDNDMLKELSGNDLTNLLVLLDDYYLKLRDTLGIDKKNTFGLEIEFENVDVSEFKKEFIKSFPKEDWTTVHDCSLMQGLEVNSPVLRDTKKSWEELETACKIIKKYGSIGRKAGGHVHVGAHILDNNPNTWLNFIRLWSVYENIIFRFAYGNYLTARPRIREYARPVSRVFWESYEFLNDEELKLVLLMQLIGFKRAQAVNLSNVKYKNIEECVFGNTIEFRCPNGTLDGVIWQNNVNLFIKLLSVCKDISLYEDIINKRHNEISYKFDDLKWYDEIYLDQALEFADIIFKNNLDKLYFLKQYLKSFQICKYKDEYPNEKTMTKKMF